MALKEGTQTMSLRLKKDLKLRIEIEAVKQNRSANNLLIHIIKTYFENEDEKK